MRSSITALFHKRPPAARVYIIAALLMGGLVGVLLAQPAPVLASDPPTQPFDLVFEASGQKLQVYNGGLGMLGQTEGTLTDVNLNGTEIVAAYLVWAGLGRDDDGITLQRVGGGPAQTLTPTAELTWNNDRYGKPTWGCCGRELSVYAADLLASGIVQLGVHDYTVADMDIQHVSGGQQVSENWGFSLIVAYVDPTLPAPRNVVIKLGNDGLFANWGEIESPSGNILGPNSDVQCFAFDAAGYEREAQFSVVVSGVASGDRHNAIWSGTGSEAYVDPAAQGGTWTQDQGLVHLPPNIVGIDIDGGKATQVAGPEEVDGVWTSPFADRSGDEWDEFPIIDVGIDAGSQWVCLQVESATRANRPELPEPGPGTTNLEASIGFLGFVGILDDPAIAIVKRTNGQDANDPDGADVPRIGANEPVTWTYEITNVGNVDIPEANITVTDNVIGAITNIIDKGDDDALLAPGEVWIYQAQGSALNLSDPEDSEGLVLVPDVCTQEGTQPASIAYTNMGTVTIPSMEAQDPSSYCGTAAPNIDIIKFTNGQDANDPDGADVPRIAPGDAVVWTYQITNIGDVDIPEADISVTDNVIGAVTNIIDKGDDDDVLAVGETWIYDANGTALDLGNPGAEPNLVLVPGVCTQEGAQPPATAYTNVGTVTIPSTSAEDSSSYCGPSPLIDIIKFTNGQDANDPDGADVPVIAPGDPAVWTYRVTNVGDVSIARADITVTDNIIGAITTIIDQADGDDILTPGEAWVYEATGAALNLVNPPADPGLQLVANVCTQDGALSMSSTAYTNIGTVTIPSMSAEDPSSYCGPPPEIDIEKFTNGQDADDPNGTDVPVVAVGAPVVWTYRITNSGPVDIAEADISVTDNVIGAVATIQNKGDGDDVLAPGEVWIYEANGEAVNLVEPPSDPALVIVANSCTQNGAEDPRNAYTNVGTVTIPSMSAEDPSSYCGPPPTAIRVTAEPQQLQPQVLIPLILR